MILSATLSGSTLPMVYEVYNTGGVLVDTQTSTGKITVGIDKLPAGGYNWKVKAQGSTQYVDFKPNETDFIMFNGFEPYPYGYKFINSSPPSSILT